MSFLFINKTLWISNLKIRTAMNEKISVLVICVEGIYLLLYNLHDCTFKVWEDKYIVPTSSIHPIPYTMIYWGKKDLKYSSIWTLWRHLDTQKSLKTLKALSHLSTWGTLVLEAHLGTQSTRALEYYKGTLALRNISTKTFEGLY